MENNQLKIKEVEPIKNLGFWSIWALGVGAVVGDGIFLLIGEGIKLAGPSAILSFVVAGLIQMCMMIGMGEFAVAMPNAGAMSSWVERIFGKWWGFLSGFAFAFGWVVTGGSTGLALGRMICWFFPSLDFNTWTVVFAILSVSIFAVLNIVGTAIAARAQLVMVLILVALMGIFGIFGLKEVNMGNFSNFMPYGFNGFFAAIPMGTYAYMGAITLATSGSECKDPRHMPKALVWASVTFLVIYTLGQFVVLGIVPLEQIGSNVSPYTAAAEMLFGKVGGTIINFAGLLAAATSILMGTIYAPSRIFYDQAKQGFLPAKFAELNPKTKTPVFGIIVVWILSVFCILLGLLSPDFYVALSMQTTFAWCISWGVTLIAAIVYRQKYLDEIEKAGWKQPLFPLFPILGLIGIAAIIYFSSIGQLGSVIFGFIWVIILAVYYKVYIQKKVTNHTASQNTSIN